MNNQVHRVDYTLNQQKSYPDRWDVKDNNGELLFTGSLLECKAYLDILLLPQYGCVLMSQPER